MVASKKKIVIAIIGLCALAIMLFTCCVRTSNNEKPPVPPQGTDETVSIYVLNVGEGLSVLIDSGEYEILIDGGYARYGEYVSGYIREFVGGSIELIIATHSDSDHVGGLTQIYEDYQVHRTIYGNTGTSGQYKSFETAARSEPNSIFENDKTESINIGNVSTLEIMDVTDNEKKANNNSVISVLETGDIRTLISGDAEAKTEKMLLDRIGNVDVYIVGHHGSETSSSQLLLDEISPAYGLISSEGPDGQYDNPDEEVMRRLLSIGTILYATYSSGDIVVTVDDNKILLSPKESDRLTIENYKNKIAA